MKHSKKTPQLLHSAGLKQKIKIAGLTMSLLVVSIGVKAQFGERNTKLGEAGTISCTGVDEIFDNTMIGYETLWWNCANNNTCVGSQAMNLENRGGDNSVLGFRALYSNSSGNNNSVLGSKALYSNSSGNDNCILGHNAAYSNTTGSSQVAIGTFSLFSNTVGRNNVAVGFQALYANKVGQFNTAIGYQALNNNTSGGFNTAIGYLAKTSTGLLHNTTAIGYGVIVNASNKVRLGGPGTTVIEGAVMYTPSDVRFKTNISETDVKGLEFIKKLRPVVYNFDAKKLDEFWSKNMSESDRKDLPVQDFSAATAIRQSGFIAQEVEKAAKEVGYNFNGLHVPENDDDNYSIAYGQFVVPLVKAVQELSKQNEEQKFVNDALKKELEELKALIKNNSTGTASSIKATETKLFQNSPNPFNQSTVIRYSISSLAKNAILTIVSINGEKVKEINLTGNTANSVEINPGELAPGNYVYSLIVDNNVVDSKKMTLTQ